jgi:hypothetical protein
LDTQDFEADRSSHDIDNGVDRADFVKVDSLDGCVVNLRFGFSKNPEDRTRSFAGDGAEIGLLNYFQDMMEVSLFIVPSRYLHFELYGIDAAP